MRAFKGVHCTSFILVAMIRHVTTADFQPLADVQAISSLIISSELIFFYARAKTSKPMEELAENVDTIPKHRASIWQLASHNHLHLHCIWHEDILRTYKMSTGDAAQFCTPSEQALGIATARVAHLVAHHDIKSKIEFRRL